MTDTVQTEAVSGVEIFVPLNKLKKSPNNARKVPHGEAAIEALAASIQHKGLIQNLVIEPETKEDGTPTGCYLVTAGEGRRLAMLPRAGPAAVADVSATDPLLIELRRCQSIGAAGASDPDCLRAWAENRRRFLAPGAHDTSAQEN